MTDAACCGDRCCRKFQGAREHLETQRAPKFVSHGNQGSGVAREQLRIQEVTARQSVSIWFRIRKGKILTSCGARH